jgi:hypothetical protein
MSIVCRVIRGEWHDTPIAWRCPTKFYRRRQGNNQGYCDSRAKTRCTVTACHFPPRGEEILRV